MKCINEDAKTIIERVILENMPQQSVLNSLAEHDFKSKVHMIAIGKAAWTMAATAADFLGDRLVKGVVITKYEHAMGSIPRTEIHEAGHPVSDENSIMATRKCIELAKQLTENDELLFLVSGGGSALFEAPADGVDLEDIKDISEQLLESGADIVEVNMIRKRLSSVKGGRFAALIAPCPIYSIVLSDILGDRLDMIASGPVSEDLSAPQEAMRVVEKYGLRLTEQQHKLLSRESPKCISNVKAIITGSVSSLCDSAAEAARDLGYTPYILTKTMNCEAREAGRLLASIAADIGNNSFTRPCAIIAGGETVVTVKGKGKGGRNQEIAFAASKGIAGLADTHIFSLGSDGTDGPTDAAGGIVCGSTYAKLRALGLNYDKTLADNDTYHALEAIDALIITGPTGTNVNDITVILCS